MALLAGEIAIDAGTAPELQSILRFSHPTAIRNPDISGAIAPADRGRGGMAAACGGLIGRSNTACAATSKKTLHSTT